MYPLYSYLEDHIVDFHYYMSHFLEEYYPHEFETRWSEGNDAFFQEIEIGLNREDPFWIKLFTDFLPYLNEYITRVARYQNCSELYVAMNG